EAQIQSGALGEVEGLDVLSLGGRRADLVAPPQEGEDSLAAALWLKRRGRLAQLLAGVQQPLIRVVPQQRGKAPGGHAPQPPGPPSKSSPQPPCCSTRRPASSRWAGGTTKRSL